MEDRWYLAVTYEDAKICIRSNLQNITRDYIALGYYFRMIQAGKLYKEDGYKNIHEFALEEYGLAKSTVNHCMRVNREFSENGNSPIVAKEYRKFNKSQLQEMLYIPEELRNDVSPDMTVKEIRALSEKRLDVEPEEKTEKPGDRELDSSNGCPPEQHDCPRQNWGTSEAEQEEGQKECKACWDEWKKRQKILDKKNEPASVTEETEKPCDAEMEISSQMTVNDSSEMPESEELEVSGMKDGEEMSGREEYADDVMDCKSEDDSYGVSEYELAKEQLRMENIRLSDMLKNYTDEDKRVRKQKVFVAALACYVYELDNITNPVPEQIQPDLPFFRNNDQRKQWLHNYEDWGLWYEDEHIGCKYYKYDFENGARLIAETYHVPKTSWYGEYDNSFFHLVGGPEPPKAKGTCCGKWQRRETYSKYPSSETELVEFLKYVQKEA